MRDYGDSRFGRFLLYLLAYRNILSVNDFEDWLNKRAQRLVDAGNAFLDELKGGL